MTDKPILFSGPMVRAILDGRKSQTRRVLKNVPSMPEPNCHPNHKKRHDTPYLDAYCGDLRTEGNPRGMSEQWLWWQVDDRACLPQFKVGYAPGDRLWVREAWRSEIGFNDWPPRDLCPGGVGIGYEADGLDDTWGKQRPSMFMPRWASRLTLTVTDVRVQRVQDIGYRDTLAEGVEGTDIWKRRQARCIEHNDECGSVCRDSFRELWDSLNASRGFGWDANPWVVAISFEAHRCNIDQMDRA